MNSLQDTNNMFVRLAQIVRFRNFVNLVKNPIYEI